MTTEIIYQKTIPIRYTADVIVLGGGPAGVAAAVQCARYFRRHQTDDTASPRVMLIEQTGSLGGAGTVGMVPEIMNFDDGVHFLSGGFGKEVCDAMFGECEMKRAWRNVDAERLKRWYDDAVTKANVKMLFYTRLIDAVTADRRICQVIVSGQEGLFAISGKVFIDCTGNASLSVLAGEETEWGDSNGHTMPATIASLWGGVDFPNKKSDGSMLEKAYLDGIFTGYDRMLSGIKKNFPEIGVGGGNVGHCFTVDDRTSESVTAAMMEGRRGLAEYERYYRGYVGGCENVRLIRSADFLGVRESRRVKCKKTLTFEHYFDGYTYEDEIGRYSYPIDIHPMTPDKEGMNGFSRSVSRRLPNGESYSIPYGCLVADKNVNLLTAGRCIGSDREMISSARVIPCCYITGQAAGIAAAICAGNGIAAEDVDIVMLQTELRAVGAYL